MENVGKDKQKSFQDFFFFYKANGLLLDFKFEKPKQDFGNCSGTNKIISSLIIIFSVSSRNNNMDLTLKCLNSQVIDALLDIERIPRKPQYTMAPEIPLVLESCEFENLKFTCPSGNESCLSILLITTLPSEMIHKTSFLCI